MTGNKSDSSARKHFTSAETIDLPRNADGALLADAVPPPQRVGRYGILQSLGRGGFADVFLARDEELDRLVALKVPRRDRFRDEEELAKFHDEARMVAQLQHPSIVTVHDVGRDGDTRFIVMEYIRGRTLLDFLKQEKLTCPRAARMLADIADAVAHADQHGFVHRDIKPQNILLDSDDHPHVADFGLALSSRDRDVSFDVAGTTHYMAPEQVRGENHRIDGRTDVWALGVTLYLMLTGRLPFPGMRNEAFRLILYSDPTPPCEIDPSIPTELERICLRCLCRQMSDRYRTAAELSHDLHVWFVSETGDTGFSTSTRRIPLIEPPEASVVPRGLRAFDGDDYDFFLQLVPGPRDRDGLPTTIGFWKKRIEDREAHSTFRVGLLYGPSGCGKSSLIKAGLLPRLNAAVAHVSIEATPQETEARLLKSLQRRFSELPECQTAAEVLYQLREHPEISQGRKVLIVIDQFEQWLQSWPSRQNEELIDALRHCDGSRVQCVLSVRDDFWLAVTRFMHLLEVNVVDGENALLVDSFDPAHARDVLRKLGAAYDRLPEQVDEMSDEQSSFIEQTIEGLSQENRLLPVRLSVLVEMCRDRPWTPDSLNAMGGTDGVGITFLENNFGRVANASRRHHETAARNILAALVPHDGQIKGSVRSRSELLDVSSYSNRPRDFDQLLRILDAELRLISPSGTPELEDSFESDESGVVIETALEDGSTQLEQRYQLTHDFLVPSIRDWLERGKRETRRGRTQLLLEEQAALWHKRQAVRFLPSLTEWAAIQLLTRRKDWRETERKLMRAATVRITRRALLVSCICVVLLLTGFGVLRGVQQRQMRVEAGLLLSRLNDVDIKDVPDVVADLQPYRELVDPELSRLIKSDSVPQRARIRAALALLPSDSAQSAWLLCDVLVSPQADVRIFGDIRNCLVPYASQIIPRLETVLRDESQPRTVRFHAACVLAGLDAQSKVWPDIKVEIVESLLLEPPAFASLWIDLLLPAAEHLCESLPDAIQSATNLSTARVGALAFFRFHDEDPAELAKLLLKAGDDQYRAVLELLKQNPEQVVDTLKTMLQQDPDTSNPNDDPERHARQTANLSLALLQSGDTTSFQEHLALSPDPTLRNCLIHGMNPLRMELTDLLPLLSDDDDEHVYTAILQAIAIHAEEPVSPQLKERLLPEIKQAFQTHPDRLVHSLAALILQRIEEGNVAEIVRRADFDEPNDSRRWFVNSAGLTMVIIDPTSVAEARLEKALDVQQTFAISTTEVTVGQLRQFRPQHQQDTAESQQIPAVSLHVLYAIGFCQWLNQQEGIPETEWCYPHPDQLSTRNFDPVAGYRNKTGYRLPTADEWEFACRAGTTTTRHFGEVASLLKYYGWDVVESRGYPQPVGQLLPNAFGLFDMHGNVSEICTVDEQPPYALVARGSGCYGRSGALMSDASQPFYATAISSTSGIRLVRTISK